MFDDLVTQIDVENVLETSVRIDDAVVCGTIASSVPAACNVAWSKPA